MSGPRYIVFDDAPNIIPTWKTMRHARWTHPRWIITSIR
jgi:hypothetical protein